MNFLAHIYLSFDNPEIKLGNFIADSVKGKSFTNYSEEIQKGILLHRKIDSYTDNHPIIKKCKKEFSAYGHYNGVILDIVLDHFLAKNWSEFHHTPLPEFIENFYKLLQSNFEILPKRVQLFYPIMSSQNWLLKYQTIAGISNILYQMNIRTRNISKMNYAVIELIENYDYLENEFFTFFKDLKAFSQLELKKLK